MPATTSGFVWTMRSVGGAELAAAAPARVAAATSTARLRTLAVCRGRIAAASGSSATGGKVLVDRLAPETVTVLGRKFLEGQAEHFSECVARERTHVSNGHSTF